MVTRLGPGAEFDLIRRFLGANPHPDPHPDPRVRLGPGDDCAVVAGDGIALTVDMAVEDVHFRRAWLEPSEIGYHAAAAALSDLAAMAARPIGILASLALGPGDEEGFGAAVMAGVAAAASDTGAALLGGDLTRSSGPLVVDIVAVGEAASPVLRSGARAGDEVWVTGRLGAAAAAVAAWLDGRVPSPDARAAFARPTPRTREALWLAERGIPTAMVDLSDGIAGDAGHIGAASGARLVIRAEALPVAEAAAAMGPAVGVQLAAAGGQDYELCFTARVGTVDGVVGEFAEEFGVGLTRVGEVVGLAGDRGGRPRTAGEGEGQRTAGEDEGQQTAGEGEGQQTAGGGVVVVDGEGEVVRVEGFQHWGGR
jgi:thiamine-monophosphate kinase